MRGNVNEFFAATLQIKLEALNCSQSSQDFSENLLSLIVIFKFLKRHSESKCRTPAYSLALR